MNFADFSDIVIPQGNVIKIHETNSGKVLWEKKNKLSSAHWEAETINCAYYTHAVLDAGEEAFFYCSGGTADESGLGEMFYMFYNPETKNFSNKTYVRHFGDDFEPGLVCVTPDKDVIFSQGDTQFYFSALQDNKVKYIEELRGASIYIWVHDLEKVGVLTRRLGKLKTCFIDKYGNVYQYKEREEDFTSSELTHRCLCYSPEANVFLLYRIRKDIRAGVYNYSKIAVYSGDLQNLIAVCDLDKDMPQLDNGTRYMDVVWASHLHAFFAIVTDKNGEYYVYKSFDGFTWIQTAIINPIKNTSGGMQAPVATAAYSPKKNVIAFLVAGNAYISSDGMSWQEISTIDNSEVSPVHNNDRFSYNRRFYWVNAFDAFIYPPLNFSSDSPLKKLVID